MLAFARRKAKSATNIWEDRDVGACQTLERPEHNTMGQARVL